MKRNIKYLNSLISSFFRSFSFLFTSKIMNLGKLL